MILPIILYGNPILRERAQRITEDSPELQRLIDDMIETMKGASGIGLAAPQVGRRERLFVVDLTPMAQDLEEELGSIPPYARGPLVFINPVLQELPGDSTSFEEGCLSIPDVREQVSRPDRIRLEYLDRDFQPGTIEADGFLARVLQHEYDHLEGVLFLDYLTPLRRRLLQRRLKAISRGEVEADYPLATEAA
jgi:peptide deformylase